MMKRQMQGRFFLCRASYWQLRCFVSLHENFPGVSMTARQPTGHPMNSTRYKSQRARFFKAQGRWGMCSIWPKAGRHAPVGANERRSDRRSHRADIERRELLRFVQLAVGAPILQCLERSRRGGGHYVIVAAGFPALLAVVGVGVGLDPGIAACARL
jgi:hypothetical protein